MSLIFATDIVTAVVKKRKENLVFFAFHLELTIKNRTKSELSSESYKLIV